MVVRLQRVYTRLFPHGFLDVARQIALFFAAYNLYRLVRGQADSSTVAAFEHGRHVIDVERSLHVFVEPSIQGWAIGKPAIIDTASWLYLNAQTTVTVGALVWLYLFRNESFYWIRNMFMVAMIIAIVGYTIYPTAPPRFFPEWGFVDSVSNMVGVSHTDKVNALFNPYAAIPSMHVCFSSMIGISISRLVSFRPAKVFWACYPLLITFVIVATANHFLTDAVLGALTAMVSAYAAVWIAKTRPTVWVFGQVREQRVPVSA